MGNKAPKDFYLLTTVECIDSHHCEKIHLLYVLLYSLLLNENAQFVILSNRQKSIASWVYIMFPHISKITNHTHALQWLELITVILSFLKIFSWEKQPLSYFNISENLQENQWKYYISDFFWDFEIKLHKICVAVTLYCFLLTLMIVSYMFSIRFPHLSLPFFRFYSTFFLLLLTTTPVVQFPMFD